ncbi:MAG TPA: MBL fold metallo-hydrolase [Acidimicrobiales bacterium]|nr:MBL fold metallo-hydrolase [Acidimicrobiales bacterium]
MHFEDERSEVHKVVVGPLRTNVYVVRDKETGRSVLLDAADAPDVLLELCGELDVTRVLQTHGHWDHVQAVPAVRAAGYEVGVSAEDAPLLPAHDFVVKDDDVIEVGGLHLRAIFTPGHTPGSMCFLVEESPVLFSGDTLFPGGPGATRRPGGDFPTIIRSIEDKLFSRLDDGIVVMPGHGEHTTVGAERPELPVWIARGW